VVAVQETLIINLHDFLSRLNPDGSHTYQYIGNSRASLTSRRPRRSARNGGGVGFLWRRDAGLSVVKRWSDTAGAFSVVITKPGFRPIAVVTVYVPTASSRYRHARGPLLNSVRTHVQALRAEFGDRVIVMGDFNARYFRRAGTQRFHADLPPAGVNLAIAPSTAALHAWAVATGMEPLHGRTLPAAEHTYGDHNGSRSELDYIFAPADAPADAIAPVDDCSWEDYLDGRPNAHAHRPLACDVTLLPAPAAPASAAAAAPAVRRQLHIPAYRHTVWHDLDTTLYELLREAGPPPPAANAAAAQAAVQRLTDLLGRAAQQWLSAPSRSIRSQTYRRLDGASVSPAVVQALELARRARATSHKLRHNSHGDLDIIARAAELFSTACEVQRLAVAQARSERWAWKCERVMDLRRIRPQDVHGLYRALARIAPDDFLSHERRQPIPGADAVPRFHAHFAGLLTEDRVGVALPLAAAADSAWRQYEPRPLPGPAGRHDWLARPVTWQEVLHVICPPSKAVPPPSFDASHAAACPMCKDTAEHFARWRLGVDDTPPSWQPRLNTSTAAGPDGIPAEAFRFTRAEDRRVRAQHRMQLAQQLAATLSDILRTGDVSAAFAESTITPLYKAAKQGQSAADPANPDAYRGIAVGNTTAKILSDVIAARLHHWATQHQLISPEQAGFRWRQGTEWHVFTLRETLKHRYRRGESTYVLFVDLKKAYDRVHLTVLWRILTDMGVPPTLVTLLRNWSGARRARVCVNGVLTDPIEMTAGVPQGDPLSPLLFNLFIECLSHYLAAQPELAGVTVTSGAGAAALTVAIRRLLYADDIACVAGNPAELCAALTHIQAWCAAYGMQIGVGGGKTEAVPFVPPPPVAAPAPHAAVAPPLPPWTFANASTGLPPVTTADGAISVKWVEAYRYLGYYITFDLRDDDAAEHIGDKLRWTWERYFARCPLLLRSPYMLQRQVFHSSVLGAVNSLRSVVLLPNADLARLDTVVRAGLRALLGLPRRSANALLLMDAKVLQLRDVVTREMLRFRLQLEMSPLAATALAPRLYRVLMALPVTPQSRSAANRLNVMPHVWAARIAAAATLGIVPGVPRWYADIPRIAHVFARTCGYHHARAAVWETEHPGAIVLPPASNGARRHVGSLTFAMRLPPAALGEEHGRTPVSALGPGCGSIIAVADSGRYPALQAAHTGARLMHMWPFANARRPDGDGPPHAGDLHLDAIAECPACGAAAIGTLYHLVTDCPAPSSVASRSHLSLSLHETVQQLASRALQLLEELDVPVVGVTAAEWAALDVFCYAPPNLAVPPHAEWRFIAYWMLMAAPWPRSATTAPGPHAGQFRAAAALGGIFDALNVPAHRLRAWASLWAGWANGAIIDIARRLRVANGLPPAARFWRYAYRPHDPRRHASSDADDAASQDGGDFDPAVLPAELLGLGFVADDDDEAALVEEHNDGNASPLDSFGTMSSSAIASSASSFSGAASGYTSSPPLSPPPSSPDDSHGGSDGDHGADGAGSAPGGSGRHAARPLPQMSHANGRLRPRPPTAPSG